MLSRLLLLRYVCLFAFLFYFSQLFAQTPDNAGIKSFETISDAEKETLTGKQAPKAPCFEIKKFQLEGNTLLWDWEVEGVTEKYEGQCLELADINKVLNELTALYFAQGYVTTRVYIIPKQDLTQGVVRMFAAEGKLEKIVLEDGLDNESIYLGNVFPGMEGDFYNLRDTEQGLDQINRLKSNKATTEIKPGKEPGKSVLVVINEAKEQQSFAFTFNKPEVIDEANVSMTMTMNNPTGLNDSLSMTFTRDLHSYNKFSKSFTSSYSIPYGYSTFSLDTSVSDSGEWLTTSASRILSQTLADSATLKAGHLLYRNSAGDKLNLTETLGHKRNFSYMRGSLVEVSSYALTLTDIELSYSAKLWGTSTTLKLGRGDGHKALGAYDTPAHSAMFLNKRHYEASFSWTVPSMWEFTLAPSLKYSGQSMDGALPTSEEFSGSRSGDKFNPKAVLTYAPAFAKNLVGKEDSTTFSYTYDAARSRSYDNSSTSDSVTGSLGLEYSLKNAFKRGGAITISYTQAATDTHDFISGSKTKSINRSYSLKYTAGAFSYSNSVSGGARTTGLAFSTTPSEPQKSSRRLTAGGKWFWGLDFAKSTIRLADVPITDAEYTKEIVKPHLGLHWGRRFGRSRFFGTLYPLVYGEGAETYQRIQLTLDTKFYDSDFTPYAGINFGYGEYKERKLDARNPNSDITEDNEKAENSIDIKGHTYGFRWGLFWENFRKKNLQIEFYYELLKQVGRDEIYIDGIPYIFEMRDIRTLGLGMNIPF